MAGQEIEISLKLVKALENCVVCIIIHIAKYYAASNDNDAA
jgi:hypothetical protein